MKWVPVALAVVLYASILGELVLAVRPGLDPAKAEDLQRAAEVVRAEAPTGQAIVHSPLFDVGELRALGDLPAKAHLPPPRLRRGPVWVIDRTEAPMALGGMGARAVQTSGSVTVRRAEPVGQPEDPGPLFDLFRDLAPGLLLVERPRGSVTSRCDVPRAAGGYACPGQAEWIYAAQHRQSIGGQERSCVWAHPTTKAGAIVYELPAPPEPPSGRLQLTIGGGLSDQAVQTPDGAPVRTEVRQGGARLGSVSVPNRRGWVEKTFEVAPGEPIRLVITAERDGARHHCINAQVTVSEGPES